MPAIDPQISGVYDDGSPGGAVRTRIARGELVVMPFREAEYGASPQGAGVGIAPQEGLLNDSEAGYGTGINFVVPAFTAAGTGAMITVPFYGSTFGVHFRKTSAVPDNLCVGVDNQYFGVKGYHEYLASRGINVTDGASLAVVADNLPDLPGGRSHVAEIIVVSSPGVATTITLWGYVVDRAAGYRPPGPYQFTTTAALTTADAAVSRGAAPNKGRALRMIRYYNADAVQRTVLLKIGGALIDKLTLTPGGREVYDFAALTAMPATFTHAAGEAGGGNLVQATSVVGF